MGRKRPDVAAASAAVDLSALPDTASTPSTDEAMVDEPMKNQQVKQSTAVDDKPTRRRKPPTSTAAAPSAAAAKPTSAQRVSSIRLIIRLIIMATAAAAIYRAVSNQTPAAVPQVASQDDTPSVDAAGNETKSQLVEAQLSTATPPEKSPAANEEVVARDDDPIRDMKETRSTVQPQRKAASVATTATAQLLAGATALQAALMTSHRTLNEEGHKSAARVATFAASNLAAVRAMAAVTLSKLASLIAALRASALALQSQSVAALGTYASAAAKLGALAAARKAHVIALGSKLGAIDGANIRTAAASVGARIQPISTGTLSRGRAVATAAVSQLRRARTRTAKTYEALTPLQKQLVVAMLSAAGSLVLQSVLGSVMPAAAALALKPARVHGQAVPHLTAGWRPWAAGPAMVRSLGPLAAGAVLGRVGLPARAAGAALPRAATTGLTYVTRSGAARTVNLGFLRRVLALLP